MTQQTQTGTHGDAGDRQPTSDNSTEAPLTAQEQAELDAEIRAELAARAAAKARLPHWVYGLIVFITAAVSLYAAFELATERVNVATDTDYVPSCTAGIYYSCKGVMLSNQAHVFYFSNMFYGMAGFGLMLGLGVLIMSGAVLPKWLKRAYVLGQLAATVFVGYLVFSIVVNIETMCLWCMLVWAMMMPMFAYLQAWAQQEKLFNLGPLGTFLHRYPWLVAIILYIAIFVTLYAKFGNDLFVF